MSAAPQTDTYVPVASDGGGDKKLRNLLGYVQQADGSVLPVYSQVVAITDGNGSVLSFDNSGFQEESLANQDKIIALLETLVEILGSR